MTVDNIDVEATIKSVQERLAQEPNLSPALRSTLDVLLIVVQLLINRLTLNSRKLECAYEQDNQPWAKEMQTLLEAILHDVYVHGGAVPDDLAKHYTERYRNLLKQAEIECPPPETVRKPGQRGRIKRSKSRNLLERLQNYEQEVLRFMTDPIVPFTNNQGENDIRMTKVHQKISGCFRSKEGADIFCRVRSYLSTCRKNNVSATNALELLFEGKLPDFMPFKRSDDVC